MDGFLFEIDNEKFIFLSENVQLMYNSPYEHA